LSPLHESCSPHSTQWSEPKPRSEPEIQLPDSFRFASASGMTGRHPATCDCPAVNGGEERRPHAFRPFCHVCDCESGDDGFLPR
jgi:hypothetical protein